MQARFGFLPEHEVQYPLNSVIISRPPEGKVRVPILIFEAGLRQPKTNFFVEIMHQYGLFVDNLTLNTIKKNSWFRDDMSSLGRVFLIIGFQVLFQLLYPVRHTYVLLAVGHLCVHHKPEGP